jgi:hypothetical protein
MKTKELAYYKRAWRIDEKGLEREGDVYARLHDAGVPNIPHIDAHGDIPGKWHTTAKERIQDKPWMKVQKERLADLRAQKHYELLMVEVGIRLTDFPTAQVAVTAIRDAIVGAPDSRRCSTRI